MLEYNNFDGISRLYKIKYITNYKTEILKYCSLVLETILSDLSTGLRIHQLHPPSPRKGKWSMTPTSICYCVSISGNLERVDNPFIAITSKFTLTRTGSTCYGPVYGSSRSTRKLIVMDKNT